MDNLVLHPLTEEQLNSFAAAPTHAVLLVGPTGSGKATLARQILGDVLGISAESYDSNSYTLTIRPEEGKAIGIDAVRQLEHFLALKVPSQQRYHRAIIIEDSQLMTAEAQNALLKTLEEPPSGSLLMLTATHPQALLPTIRSRAQAIQLRRPEQAKIAAFFDKQGHTPAAIKQAHAVSGGLPGLMAAILGDKEHPLLLATQYARQILSQTAYERLLLVDELAKQKQLAYEVTFILQQMAHVSLQQASGPAARRWQAVLEASHEAATALQNSAQPKLALLNLMLSF